MSFFHKTLKDVEAKLVKGDIDGALYILWEHHAAQHNLSQSIAELIKKLVEYGEGIKQLTWEIQHIKNGGESYSHRIGGLGIEVLTERADSIREIMINLLEEESKLK